MDIKQIIRAIKPYVLEWIDAKQAQDIGAHNLNGTMHSGTLGDSQAPQFLKTDGSRQLTGDLSVADLKTIDGVDLSVLGSSVTGHLAATAAAGHGSVGAHNHQTAANGDLLDHGAALSGLGDDDHTQYLNTLRHDTTTRHTLGTVVPHDDHGALSGLADDDHTQYLLVSGLRDVAGSLLPAATDRYDLGSSSRLWRKGYLSELDALVFSENSIALVGGWLMICKDQGTLPIDIAAADTMIDFGKTMTPNDFVLFRGYGQVEYIRVGTVVKGTKYNVTRNLDGSGANAWKAGSPFAVLGGLGDGRIELNAYDTPRISMFQYPRIGEMLYDADRELIRLGDLNGNWGYSASKYGIAIGAYEVGKANIVIDEDGVMQFRNYGTAVMRFGGSTADITSVLRLPGTESALAIGSSPPTASNAGTGIWIDRTGLYTLVNDVYQLKILASDGSLYAGGGGIRLGAGGIELFAINSYGSSLITFQSNLRDDIVAKSYSRYEPGGLVRSWNLELLDPMGSRQALIRVNYGETGYEGALESVINLDSTKTNVTGILRTDTVTNPIFNGWVDMSHQTWTRLSNTTFRVSGDQTAIFTPGTKIRVTQTSTKYFYVVSSSYSSPNTTVTITGGADYSLTASPTAQWVSYVANPQGFPDWFNWAPTVTGFSSVPATVAYRFKILGRQVFMVIAQKTDGTSNANTLSISLPVGAASIGTGGTWTGSNGFARDNGANVTAATRWNINSGGTTIEFYKDMAAATWTASGGKRVYCEAWYEF